MKKRAVCDTVHGKVQAMHCIPYQNKHRMKTEVFLHSVTHNSVKTYWGVEVKFPWMRLTAGVVMQA